MINLVFEQATDRWYATCPQCNTPLVFQQAHQLSWNHDKLQLVAEPMQGIVTVGCVECGVAARVRNNGWMSVTIQLPEKTKGDEPLSPIGPSPQVEEKKITPIIPHPVKKGGDNALEMD